MRWIFDRMSWMSLPWIAIGVKRQGYAVVAFTLPRPDAAELSPPGTQASYATSTVLDWAKRC
jgi:hypothetical protein